MTLLALASLAYLVAGDPNGPNCATFTFCEDCATQISWSGAHCRWCPKDGECHAYGSLFNKCSIGKSITDPSQCPAPAPTPPSPAPSPDTRHWCNGTTLPKLGAGNIDVFFAQAPLFSTDPSVGDKLGKLGLHHTCLVFQQDQTYWTLEFDLTAQNKDGHSNSDGFLPTVDGLQLTWDNEARWCLTEGLLHGRDHWKTSFKSFAQIPPAMFHQFMNDFVPSVNGTTGGLGVGYNLFYVVDHSGKELVPDVTCANGPIWVRDYLVSQGVAIASNFTFDVTRFQIRVESITTVTPSDTEVWEEVVDFYKQMHNVTASDDNIYGIISRITAIFPLQFVYDSNKKTYFKLNDCAMAPNPKFEIAPSPWPIPSTMGASMLLA